MPRLSPELVSQIKLDTIIKIEQGCFTVEKMPQWGNSVYKVIELNIYFDLIFASLNSRNEYFFGIEKEQYETIKQLGLSFYQIFICGNSELCFMLPKIAMDNIISNKLATVHQGFSQWEPIIRLRENGYEMRFLGVYKIEIYLNHYHFL